MSTRMLGRVSYIGEVLQCCRARDSCTQPSRSVGQLGQAVKQKCPFVKLQRYRIKKSQHGTVTRAMS